MKPSPSSRRGRASREAELLVDLAEGLANSGSRAEDEFWEPRLSEAVLGLIGQGDEGSLNAALDRLAERESRAYEELADTIEGLIESGESRHARVVRGDIAALNEPEVLLFAAPLLVWSRLPVPTKPIDAAATRVLHTELLAQVFSPGAEVSLVNYLFSPDQLPETFLDTLELRHALTQSMGDGTLGIDPQKLAEATQYLADQRYVLGLVRVPAGSPIFRWQDGMLSRDEVLAAWRKSAEKVAGDILPACAVELLLPRAYYVACREADRAARPFSVRASVAFLSTTLSIRPDQIKVVIAGCYSRQLEEYRLGFLVPEVEELVHGVVWPLLGSEDDMSDIGEQIEAALREAGIEDIETLGARLPLEYCEDCGTPLYPNPDGELVHAELPEAVDPSSRHLH